MKTRTQFVDIKNKFSAPPISLSAGSIANYLDELSEEHKIQKWREGSNVYYTPPKMSSISKTALVTVIICNTICVLLSLLYFIKNAFFLNELLSQWFWLVITGILGLEFGVLLTCILWWHGTKSINTKSRKE
jgi:hypothetical protein